MNSLLICEKGFFLETYLMKITSASAYTTSCHHKISQYLTKCRQTSTFTLNLVTCVSSFLLIKKGHVSSKHKINDFSKCMTVKYHIFYFYMLDKDKTGII